MQRQADQAHGALLASQERSRSQERQLEAEKRHVEDLQHEMHREIAAANQHTQDAERKAKQAVDDLERRRRQQEQEAISQRDLADQEARLLADRIRDANRTVVETERALSAEREALRQLERESDARAREGEAREREWGAQVAQATQRAKQAEIEHLAAQVAAEQALQHEKRLREEALP